MSFPDSIALLYWKRQLEAHLSNQQQLKTPHNTPTDVESVHVLTLDTGKRLWRLCYPDFWLAKLNKKWRWSFNTSRKSGVNVINLQYHDFGWLFGIPIGKSGMLFRSAWNWEDTDQESWHVWRNENKLTTFRNLLQNHWALFNQSFFMREIELCSNEEWNPFQGEIIAKKNW